MGEKLPTGAWLLARCFAGQACWQWGRLLAGTCFPACLQGGGSAGKGCLLAGASRPLQGDPTG